MGLSKTAGAAIVGGIVTVVGLATFAVAGPGLGGNLISDADIASAPRLERTMCPNGRFLQELPKEYTQPGVAEKFSPGYVVKDKDVSRGKVSTTIPDMSSDRTFHVESRNFNKPEGLLAFQAVGEAPMTPVTILIYLQHGEGEDMILLPACFDAGNPTSRTLVVPQTLLRTNESFTVPRPGLTYTGENAVGDVLAVESEK